MAGKERSWPRAAWFASEIPAVLTVDVRQELAKANPGHAVTPEALDKLDRALGEILYRGRLDVSTKARRAEVAELRQAARALYDAIRGLHPRSTAEVLTSLRLSYGQRPDLLRDLPRSLVVLEAACADALRAIPAQGGRTPEHRRDAVVAFVDGLHLTRARRVIRGALARTAANDRVNVPLRSSDVDDRRRWRESVKAVLSALTYPVPVDLDAIIAKTLPEKPT